MIEPDPFSGAPTIANELLELIATLLPNLSPAVVLAVVFMPVVDQGLVFCNTFHLPFVSLST